MAGIQCRSRALLAGSEPVKTVSERLGHMSVTVTLTVCGHVMPGDQKEAEPVQLGRPA
jgi:hypothetical protein